MEFCDEFDTHNWSDKTLARNLINSAKDIIVSNPTKSSLRPIVIKLYELLPDIDKKGGLTDTDDSVLTN